MIAFVKNEAMSSQRHVEKTKLKINLPATEKDKIKKKLIQ